jgi:hypothetical protein
MWPRGNTRAENHTAERLRRGTLRWAGDVLCNSRVVPGGTIVSDAQLARAEYYRQTAEEIRRFARQSRFPEIGKELSELAERFDRMAAFVESRQLGHPIGLAPERYPEGTGRARQLP